MEVTLSCSLIGKRLIMATPLATREVSAGSSWHLRRKTLPLLVKKNRSSWVSATTSSLTASLSLVTWPKPDEAKVDISAEENEDLIRNILEDTLNILKATNITPEKICYYTAASWKWKVYRKALEKSVSAKIVQSDLMKELMQDADLQGKAKHVAKFVGQIIDEVNHMPNEKKHRQLEVGIIDENKALKTAEDFFKRELDAEICIYKEDDHERYDPKQRAQLARPYRPAIYIE